jgi:hypothetical protein
MVSPVHGDYRRCQAETPLIALFKFAEPALSSSAALKCGAASSGEGWGNSAITNDLLMSPPKARTNLLWNSLGELI